MYQHNLDPGYISATFSNTGQFEVLVPLTVNPSKHETAYVRYDPPNTFVKLVDNTQHDIVTMMTLTQETHFGKSYYVIKLSKSEYQQRGHLKYLLSILLMDYDFILMSDYLHTLPGSMDVWRKIKSWDRVQTRIVNVQTGYIRKYTNQKDHKIWGLSEEFFINGQLNAEAIDDLKEKGRMSYEFYSFVDRNQDDITDRQNIRLVAQKIAC
jgi:hypothetical protein